MKPLAIAFLLSTVCSLVLTWLTATFLTNSDIMLLFIAFIALSMSIFNRMEIDHAIDQVNHKIIDRIKEL